MDDPQRERPSRESLRRRGGRGTATSNSRAVPLGRRRQSRSGPRCRAVYRSGPPAGFRTRAAAEAPAAFLGRTSVHAGDDDSGLATQFLGEIGYIGYAPQQDLGRHLIRRLLSVIAPGLEQIRCLLERIHHGDGHYLRTDRVQPVLECGHNAEVSATSSYPPEEVCILRRARGKQTSVGTHHLCGEEVVAGEAVLASQQPYPATQGESRNPGLRNFSAGCRQAEHLSFSVEVGPGSASFGADRVPL